MFTDENIGNSHNESFVQMVYKSTRGKGVDVVLNTSTGDRLVASVRCLTSGGRFLEIGKSDLANNVHLNLMLLKKQASFHGIMLDKIFDESAKFEIKKVFQKVIEEGGVKPLNRTVFEHEEMERALRFVTNGKYIGKVLMKIREPEKQLVALPGVQKLLGIARYA